MRQRISAQTPASRTSLKEKASTRTMPRLPDSAINLSSSLNVMSVHMKSVAIESKTWLCRNASWRGGVTKTSRNAAGGQTPHGHFPPAARPPTLGTIGTALLSNASINPSSPHPPPTPPPPHTHTYLSTHEGHAGMGRRSNSAWARRENTYLPQVLRGVQGHSTVAKGNSVHYALPHSTAQEQLCNEQTQGAQTKHRKRSPDSKRKAHAGPQTHRWVKRAADAADLNGLCVG